MSSQTGHATPSHETEARARAADASQFARRNVTPPMQRLQQSLGNQAITQMLLRRHPIAAVDCPAERQAAAFAGGAGQPVGIARATSDTNRTAAPGSHGRPLEPQVRRPFEQALSADLSSVRIHDDVAAHAFARSVGARAATMGSHIYFNEGRYAPQSHVGRALLSHELVHTLQPEARTMLHRTPESEARLAEIERLLGTRVITEDYRHELEAERATLLEAGTAGGAQTTRASQEVLQRQDHAAEVAEHTNNFQTAVRAYQWREAIGVLAWFNAKDIDALLGASNLGLVELLNLRETAKEAFPADVDTNPDHIANIVDRKLQAFAQASSAPLSGGAAIAAQHVSLATSVERSHWHSDAERLQFIKEYLDYAKGKPDLQALYDEGIARYGDQIAAASRLGAMQESDPLVFAGGRSKKMEVRPARAVRIVQFSHFMVGMGEVTVIVTLPEGALQFGPDPSAGYNFDTYLVNMDTGQEIPAQWLGGTRYRVFMGTEECPGCHFGQGLVVDLLGENPAVVMLPPVLASLASIAEGAAAERGLERIQPPQPGLEPVKPPDVTRQPSSPPEQPTPEPGRRLPVPRPLQGGGGGSRTQSAEALAQSGKRTVKGSPTGPLGASKPESGPRGQDVAARGENLNSIALNEHRGVTVQSPEHVPEYRDRLEAAKKRDGLSSAKNPDHLVQGPGGVWQAWDSWTPHGDTATVESAIGRIFDKVGERQTVRICINLDGVKTDARTFARDLRAGILRDQQGPLAQQKTAGVREVAVVKGGALIRVFP